jgi:hypothetical protein
LLARIDDRRRPGYPGLVLALVPGEHPLLARRVNYFESPRFIGYFDPHPNHPPPPTLAELAAQAGAARGLLPPATDAWKATAQRLIWWCRRLLWLTYRSGRTVVRAGIALGFLLVAASFVIALFSQDDTGGGSPSTARAIITKPPTATGQADVAPLAAPQPAPAYTKGAADWRDLQAWFTSQTGDRRAGADYWAGNRGDRNHRSCADASDNYGSTAEAVAAFKAGCLDAKNHLDPIDARRADPQYKAGFNDEAKRLPLSSGAANSSNGSRFATVSTVNLNLRAGPGADNASVAILPQGTRVKLVNDPDGNGWQELDVPGQALHGFANSRFLTPAP